MDKVSPALNDKDWGILLKTPLEYEAYLVCGLLETHDIPYYLQRLKHIPHPVSLGQLGSYVIWIPLVWFKIAKILIKHGQG
jgi:hypothetical protein